MIFQGIEVASTLRNPNTEGGNLLSAWTLTWEPEMHAAANCKAETANGCLAMMLSSSSSNDGCSGHAPQQVQDENRVHMGALGRSTSA